MNPTPTNNEMSQSEDISASPPVNGRAPRMSFAALVRWLHIYLSMFGFATILFFSITGITLNHPTWFGFNDEQITEHQGRLEQNWVKPAKDSTATLGQSPDQGVNKLSVAEYLRATHKLRGQVAIFQVDEEECLISFKGPGYAADAVIDRASGEYDLTISQNGAIAVVNDLHKGRDTGWLWSIVIDVSAILMAISSITGIILLLYLKRRRNSGLIVTAIGAVVLLALYYWGVK